LMKHSPHPRKETNIFADLLLVQEFELRELVDDKQAEMRDLVHHRIVPDDQPLKLGVLLERHLRQKKKTERQRMVMVMVKMKTRTKTNEDKVVKLAQSEVKAVVAQMERLK